MAAPEEVIEICLPTSKSVAIRMMVLSFVVTGRAVTLPGLSGCGDVDELRRSLAILAEGSATPSLHIEEGGAPYRFLKAILAAKKLTDPNFRPTLTCGRRLSKRPIAPLDEGLSRLEEPEVVVDASLSSQFISALMMAAPLVRKKTLIRSAAGPWATSVSYMEMTAAVMRMFGFDVEVGSDFVSVKEVNPRLPRNLCGEADWSAASFFIMYEAVATHYGIHMPKLIFPGLLPPEDSLQADSGFPAILKKGVEQGHLCANLSKMPDAVPALVVGLVIMGISFHLTGLTTLRHKESDRLAALSEELARVGYSLRIGDDSDSLSWEPDSQPSAEPSQKKTPLLFSSHADHRMVMALMAFAIAGRRVEFDNPEVVAKSFPGFFREFAKLPT